jgi:hypothetical protein
MRLKLAVVIVYLAVAAVPSSPVALTQTPAPDTIGQQGRAIALNLRGRRGVVMFNHKTHETMTNPDATTVFPARAGAACAGCHHTDDAMGIPQLVKCHACHSVEGHPKNPKNRDFDEVFAERAFHDSCISCHRASNQEAGSDKAPTSCTSCHRSTR